MAFTYTTCRHYAPRPVPSIFTSTYTMASSAAIYYHGYCTYPPLTGHLDSLFYICIAHFSSLGQLYAVLASGVLLHGGFQTRVDNWT